MKIEVTKNNTHITDSYKVKNKGVMFSILMNTRIKYSNNSDLAIHKRTLDSMVREWRAHNFLYEIKYKRERTKDVDLDINEPWYRKTGYFILSLLYNIF